MAEIRRLNLNFNLAYPKQAKVWSLLCGIPVGHRMEEICDAILERDLEDRFRSILREELRQGSYEPTHEEPDSEDGDAALDFLSALQEGADFI